MTGRRSFLAAALFAPVAIAAPASAGMFVCAPEDPIAEYLEACRALDEDDPASVERHDASEKAFHDWEPATAQDMLRKIVAKLDERCAPPETSLRALIQQVDRLVTKHA